MTTEALIQLLEHWGLLLLFPLAVIEGPIVTIIAGWFVRLGLWPFGWVYVACIVADLLGDLILYALGRGGARWLPAPWRRRMGLDDRRLAKLGDHFGSRGARTLVWTKLSHSLGFAVLPAAGAARMPVGSFLFWNLVAALPKTLVFLALGYMLGEAHQSIDGWIGRASVAVVAVAICVVAVLWYRRRNRTTG